jgi:xanthine dehydrogenase accessory factor
VSTTELFLARLAVEDAVLITVHSSRGSVPREAGAWMGVFKEGAVGTVGGGHLEFAAMAQARLRLHADPQGAAVPAAPHASGEGLLRFALGPSLGQCCGGEVQLQLERVTRADLPQLQNRLTAHQMPVALFGGGHVGHALVQVLGNLPIRVNWFDSRHEIFPTQLPANTTVEHSDPVQAAVPTLPAGSQVLIMSFSHAEDLDVVAACLLRLRVQDDLPFVGLIGSKTKWATFRHRLQARGFSEQELARITCPIGVPGIAGKAPEVIAVAVAAQLLQGFAQR